MKVLLLLCLALPIWGARIPHQAQLITSEDSYIIGGRDVDITEFPHQCSLQFIDGESHTCGCTIVALNYMLTAAHCVSRGARSYQIRYGSTSRTTGLRRFLTQARTHPDFEMDGSQGFPNDIAVIRTLGLITEGPNARPIRMADPDEGTWAGERCNISGWGRTITGGGGGLPIFLVAAKTTIYATATCQGRWPQVREPQHVCIGGMGNEGSCNGDSGGPLTCLVDGTPVVVGLTSWGRSGCLTTHPSVYVRVSTYKEWVDDIIGFDAE